MHVQGVPVRVSLAFYGANLRRWFLRLCSVAAALMLFAPGLPAQTTSSLEGTVRDKQGLAISGAQVQGISAELAIDRSVTTDADGNYRIPALPPGVYGIRVSKTGF